MAGQFKTLVWYEFSRDVSVKITSFRLAFCGAASVIDREGLGSSSRPGKRSYAITGVGLTKSFFALPTLNSLVNKID